MTTEDPEHERQRLSKLYQSMSEEDLRKFAADAAALTDVAYEALADEIERRGLDIPLNTSVAIDKLERQELVTVRQFRDLPETLLAKAMLDSAGIESHIADDNLVRMNWYWSNLIGGLRLQVKPEDAAAANEILSQPIPEGFEVEGDGEYRQPHCPKCQSLDIVFEPLHKGIGLATGYLFGVPLPIQRNSWLCQSCGQRWQELPDTEPAL